MPAPKSGALGRACAPAVAIAALVFLLMATSAQAGTYTVRWGDTLSGIAGRPSRQSDAAGADQPHPCVRRAADGQSAARARGARRTTAAARPSATIVIPTTSGVPNTTTPMSATTGAGTCMPVSTRCAPARSLSLIAARYHSSVRILTRANHRRSGGLLLVGTRLLIPLRHRSHRHRAHHAAGSIASTGPLAATGIGCTTPQPFAPTHGWSARSITGPAATRSTGTWCGRSAGRNPATTPTPSPRSVPAECCR